MRHLPETKPDETLLGYKYKLNLFERTQIIKQLKQLLTLSVRTFLSVKNFRFQAYKNKHRLEVQNH